jgi:hypothetical protein
VSIELAVFIIKLVAVITKSFQHVQLEVEPIQIKNPHFSKFQPTPIYGQSIKTLR